MLDFFLTLSARDKRYFWFVSTNMCQIYLHNVNILSDANRERTFIVYDKNDIIELVSKKTANTCHNFGDKSIYVHMYLGVDATITVRGWQIIRSNNKIIGGASKKQYFGYW